MHTFFFLITLWARTVSSIPCCSLINSKASVAIQRRLYDVASTSMQRHDVASTLRRRSIDVMCPLGQFSFNYYRTLFRFESCTLPHFNWHFDNSIWLSVYLSKTVGSVALSTDLIERPVNGIYSDCSCLAIRILRLNTGLKFHTSIWYLCIIMYTRVIVLM